MKSLRFLVPVLLLAAVSCTEKGSQTDLKFFDNQDLYCKTVKKLNDVVMENNFPPIIASRNYTYASIAAFECVAAGDNNYISLAGQIKHMPAMPKPDPGKKIDYSLAALFAFTKVGNAVTFPEGSMMEYYDDLKRKADSIGMPSSVLENTIKFSDSIVSAILNWSKKDNYAQTRTSERYNVLYDDPARWIPTPPMYATALEPHWSEIRAMVLDSSNQFMPAPPPLFDMKNKNSKYYQEVLKVKNAIDSLTPEQQHIADFWDDLNTKLNVSGHVMFMTKKFSPPGHWMNIVGIAAEKSKADFNKTVYAYAKTSIAMFDAFIECWDVKFKYNTVRPETVINKYIDENWRPHLQTPPFPEYTCGHSTCSSAAAEALTSVFGDNFAYTDTSELEFNIKNRSFTSFRQAAEENNWARFYGGIHFHNTCIISSEQGRLVGDFVNKRLRMTKEQLAEKK